MTDPKPVELTEAEIVQLEAAERPFFITHNLGASGKHHTQLTGGGARAIAAIVTAREAAARREALLEAAEELDALPSYRSGRGFMYSHETDFADGRDEEAERIADWLRVLAEPERDEESVR